MPAKSKPTKRNASKKTAATKQAAAMKKKKKAPAKKPVPAKKRKAPAAKAAASKTHQPTASEMYRGPNLQQHPVSPQQMAAVAADGLRSDGEILQVETAEVAPCRLVDHGSGRYSLCFDDYAMPDAALFAQLGLQGGGYTWEAIVKSLVKSRHPELASELSYDSEAGMFVAIGPRAALVTVAKLIRSAIADATLLRSAVERADPDMLE